jgi:unsaturated chondroitin disaccharide hydrolase
MLVNRWRVSTRSEVGGLLGRIFALPTVACVLATLIVAMPAVAAQPSVALVSRLADLPDSTIEHDFEFAAHQLDATTRTISSTRYPSSTSSTGSWNTTSASAWTSGFFPGALWLMFERSGVESWKNAAQAWQAGIESQKDNTSTHDLGFEIFTSFGNGYRLTGNDAYRQVILTAAMSLSTRYNATVGCIKARTGTTGFRTLIDTMMNIELLFWASKHGGSSAWYDMAVSHALKTRANHVRADGSTYQWVDYDPTTGAVVAKGNGQGYDPESSWSRGQAWAIYGFTTAYRETGDTRFLDTARRTASYFIAHLPPDYVPYWDFELPSTTGQPRDSSAATVAASGLLELSRLEPDASRAADDLEAAKTIIGSLSSSSYLAEGTANAAVLLHGTQNKPAGSYDTGLIFGDYYFLEALLRLPRMNAGTLTFTPTDDGYVRSNYASENAGSDVTLRVYKSATSETQSYLKFTVSGVTDPVTSAKLRLNVTDASAVAGNVYGVTDTSWREGTITWANRPPAGSRLATGGAAPLGSWVEFDLTGAVTRDGTYSFALKDGSGDAARYSSKEGTKPPQLIVTLGGGGPVPPTASFTASPTSGTAPLTVNFTDSSSGGPTSWAWDFQNDGTIDSTGQNPVFTYTSPGSYTVKLTVANDAGSNGLTKASYITVSPSGGSTSLTFTPTDDAYVRSNYPNENAGAAVTVRTYKSGTTETYSFFKFTVSGITGPVTSVKLRLFVTDGSPVAGRIYGVTDTSWSEGTITWTTRPVVGSPLGSGSSAPVSTWVEFDLGGSITGAGTYSFVLKDGSSDAAWYSSEEGANSPKLLVAFAS